jgi:hypothetical protein
VFVGHRLLAVFGANRLDHPITHFGNPARTSLLGEVIIKISHQNDANKVKKKMENRFSK